MSRGNAAISSIYDRGAVEPGDDGINPAQQEDEQTITDTPEMRDRIRGAVGRIQALKIDRKQINDEITAEYSDLESHGVNRQAVKEAIKRLEMNETKRVERDFSYALVLRALGIAYQADLFAEKLDNQSA